MLLVAWRAHVVSRFRNRAIQSRGRARARVDGDGYGAQVSAGRQSVRVNRTNTRLGRSPSKRSEARSAAIVISDLAAKLLWRTHRHKKAVGQNRFTDRQRLRDRNSGRGTHVR